MGDTVPITAMIFTLNEEVNIKHCLESLTDFDDIICVDSGSEDDTKKICEDFGASVYENVFTGFGDQRNWAFENTNPKYEWVLILDADERLTKELIEEIVEKTNAASPEVSAFRLKRKFHLWDKWLRYSSLYPSWVVRLVRTGKVKYINRGHAETQQVDGILGVLENALIDKNEKGAQEWWERQVGYAKLEALYELQEQRQSVQWWALVDKDPLKRRNAFKLLSYKMPFRSFAYFLYSYVLRLGFLDGQDGLMFCRMRAIYYQLIEFYKYDLSRGEKRD